MHFRSVKNWFIRKKSDLPIDFDTSTLPMWVFDRDTLRFLAVNNAAIALYGYSIEEFLQMTLRDIRPAFDIQRLEQHISELSLYTAQTGVWKHRKKDGAIILVTVCGEDVRYKGKKQRLITVENITPSLTRFAQKS